MTHDDVRHRLLHVEAADPGCDACLARLDVWADGVASGLPGEVAEPTVAAHLRSCAACSEDAEGLLALVTPEAPDS
ncbi:hypothetical protein [Patulibacter americanus]|uniref:hypothetical protein n=1 Tax=Patulibacter americanus TaxID=588672 RepID=UPI0003B476DE|nr:hypothetical protein [Patulibacter americanus]